MLEQRIATGSATDLMNLKQYESRFQEGDKGKLIVHLRWGLPDQVVKSIDSAIRRTGVKLTSPVKQTHHSPGKLEIKFQKGLPPLAPIAAAVFVIGLLVIVKWQLDRLPAPVAALAGGSILIGVVVAIVLVLWLLIKGPSDLALASRQAIAPPTTAATPS